MKSADRKSVAHSSRVRIVFGGGGEVDDERPLLNVVRQWVEPAGHPLHFPIASDPPYEASLEWLRATLRPIGAANIAIVTSLEQLSSKLRRAEAVFIGGGNTYGLLDALRQTGADRLLRRVAEGGSPVYGGSAGAILLGRDIRTASHMDPYDAGLTDTTGLDLALTRPTS